MKNIYPLILSFLFVFSTVIAQEKENQQGHYNTNKFRQLKQELPTPDKQHTASGAPGHEYTQQQVDYVMDIILDEDNQKIFGNEKITYHNNSNDKLEYLWLQLDQNVRAPDSDVALINGSGPALMYSPAKFTKDFFGKPFPGGFNIETVKDAEGNPLSYTINKTMMRINLKKPIAPKSTFQFQIKWSYNINNFMVDRGRSGYEHFDKDGNDLYVIAQFFPRLAVYNNVEGWQNLQFTGRSEFALEFGNYNVKITTPKDHILNATGVLKNPKEVLSKTQIKRLDAAKKSFDNPVLIVTQEEAELAEKSKSKETKIWNFYAENVRDFAFASSRKFIWDGMAVDINGKAVMAYSLYPKEGNPLWEEHSTRVVASTLKTYSKYTFDYPYHKAISVHANRQGMEYPQICWNGGRPREDGSYSERTRNGMIGVITHEVGHNFFPMIVNSDERQWAWMDEGLDTFVQILAQRDYMEDFPIGRGLPKNIVGYMSGDQSNLAPIMSHGDNVFDYGANAYSKPAAGLYMLRETILGHDLFDYAFKTYSSRWKFKHPTPADFFRTMEDASAVDLDWFWRGWFYTTDNTDIGIKEVKKYYVTNKPSDRALETGKRYGMSMESLEQRLYLTTEEGNNYSEDLKDTKPEDFTILKEYIETNLSEEEKASLKIPKYFYEITFEKPGGLVMPIIVEYTYEDGTTKREKYPAQIWRLNDKQVSKVVHSTKAIVAINIDPDLETADVDTSNNSWPKKTESDFDKFKKKQLKG